MKFRSSSPKKSMVSTVSPKFAAAAAAGVVAATEGVRFASVAAAGVPSLVVDGGFVSAEFISMASPPLPRPAKTGTYFQLHLSLLMTSGS